MIDTLINDVKYEYINYYALTKEALLGKGIKFSYRVRFSFTEGIQCIDEQKNPDDPLIWHNLKDFQSFINPLFYNHTYIHYDKSHDYHLTLHIPYFNSEELEVKVSLEDTDDWVFLHPRDILRERLNPLIKHIKPEPMFLKLHVSLKDQSKEREEFEKNLTYFPVKKIYEAEANRINHPDIKGVLKSLEENVIPYNSVYKTLLLKNFLQDYHHFEPNADYLRFINQARYVRRYEKILKDQNHILEICKDHATIRFNNPCKRINTPYRFY